jgi:hypothetical protein
LSGTFICATIIYVPREVICSLSHIAEDIEYPWRSIAATRDCPVFWATRPSAQETSPAERHARELVGALLLLARFEAMRGHRGIASRGRQRTSCSAWAAGVSSVMVERYAHLAPDHLAKAAGRLDSLLSGYDLATSKKKRGGSLDQPLDLLVGRAGIEPATNV